jgi:5-formyltetrahydrofolate cyclo-ligase
VPSSAVQRLEEVARVISAKMRDAADPDSHFHLDFSQFIPGFRGSTAAAAQLVAHPACRQARQVFATPDNALLPLRRMLLEEGKDLVIPSYGLHRGFMLIEAARIPKGQALFASWLEGVEHFGRPVSLRELRSRGRLDLIVTGASAITRQGLRFGMGCTYLDVEWGVLAESGVVTPDTPIAAVVHDLQVVDEHALTQSTDVLTNYIVTPTRLFACPPSLRPSGLEWSIVSPDLAVSPALRELRA